MINSNTINNLIAQTNYLSTMFQSYHDILLKQSHSHNNNDSKSLQSEQIDSIFDSSESQHKSQPHNFLSNSNESNLISPYLNPSPYQSDIFDHQIIDRPTGYMRDQDKTQLKDRILTVQSSIQFCFKAIQSQLEIRKILNQKGMLQTNLHNQKSNSLSDTKTQNKQFKKSIKPKRKLGKLKSK